MANHSSAKKMISVIARRTEVNRVHRSRMRTFVRKALEAIGSGSKEAAVVAFRLAESTLQKCANKGIIHKNNAARKVKRLYAKLRSMPEIKQ